MASAITKSERALRTQLRKTKARVVELEATINAIRSGDVDGVVVEGPHGSHIYTLQSPEEPYRVLAEGMSEGAATLTTDGIILFCNRRLAEIAGRPAERLLGSSFLELLRAEERDAFPELLKAAREMSARAESHLLRSDAVLLPVQLSLSSIPFEEDEQGICLVATDLSEQKRVHETRELLAAVVESCDDAIISKTLDGTIIAWNRGAEKVFGYSSSEAVGHPMLMLFPTERRDEESDILGRVGRGESVEHFETVRVRKDGRKIDVSLTISPIKDSRGVIVGASKIARDITERKRAERARLSLSDCNESMMRATDEAALLRQICDLVVNVGGYRMAWVGYADHDEKKTVRVAAQSGFEDGYLDTVNLTWADKERGRGPAGTAIRSGHSAVCPNTMTDPHFAPWREEALRRGYRSTMALPLKSGDAVLGAITIYATEAGVFDEAEQRLLEELSNNLSYGIRALRTRQERLRAQEETAKKAAELARSNADLEQFAYVASHDLQEPLRMVTAYTQLLAERYRGKLDEKADTYIAYASEGAQRMQVLIQDLLAFSRIGRNGASSVSINCNALLKDVLRSLDSAIQQSGAVITAVDLPTVWADRTQLAQVFQNLIGNAIKFHGQAPPRVSIGAEKSGDHCLLSVNDNGIGIAPEHAENIFVVFQRLHTRSEYPGNGIGLAICKKIIERGGGRIWVESEPGFGSTFKFTLPLRGPDKQEAQHETNS